MNERDRDEIITGLAVVQSTVQRIEKLLDGNGREGLVQTVTRLDERGAASKKERAAVGGGVTIAMVATFFDQIKALLGALKQ